MVYRTKNGVRIREFNIWSAGVGVGTIMSGFMLELVHGTSYGSIQVGASMWAWDGAIVGEVDT